MFPGPGSARLRCRHDGGIRRHGRCADERDRSAVHRRAQRGRRHRDPSVTMPVLDVYPDALSAPMPVDLIPVFPASPEPPARPPVYWPPRSPGRPHGPRPPGPRPPAVVRRAAGPRSGLMDRNQPARINRPAISRPAINWFRTAGPGRPGPHTRPGPPAGLGEPTGLNGSPDDGGGRQCDVPQPAFGAVRAVGPAVLPGDPPAVDGAPPPPPPLRRPHRWHRSTPRGARSATLPVTRRRNAAGRAARRRGGSRACWRGAGVPLVIVFASGLGQKAIDLFNELFNR